jgi:hypothetical protein
MCFDYDINEDDYNNYINNKMKYKNNNKGKLGYVDFDIKYPRVIVIDMPQMIHINKKEWAKEYFKRDLNECKNFFERKFNFKMLN